MRILVIMHVESEGPGTIGSFFADRGAEITTARLHAGDRFTEPPHRWNAIVTMGGPMNVYEEDKYPYLREETAYLREAIEVANVPVLGVCLGAQMIAKACGAWVTKAPMKEVGWYTVSLVDGAKDDGLLRGLPPELPVFQWHEDTFEIPFGGRLLATGNDCPNQAFRVRDAYGLQFHVEATREMLEEWFADAPSRQAHLDAFDRLRPEIERNATRIYDNFAAMIGHG